MDESVDTEAARQGLLALEARAITRSKSSHLRSLLPEVERALAAGASRAEVLAELTKAGLQMTPATFGTTLSRLRKRAKRSGPADSQVGLATALVPSANSVLPAPPAPEGSVPTRSSSGTPSAPPVEPPYRRRPTLEEVLRNKPNVSALEQQYDRDARAGKIDRVSGRRVEATGETLGQTPTAGKPTSRP